MGTDSRVADFYVLLEPRGYRKAAAVGTRMTRPATTSSQIAVRVRLTLPPDAFTTWTPLVEATIEPATFIPPTVDILEPEEAAVPEAVPA